MIPSLTQTLCVWYTYHTVYRALQPENHEELRKDNDMCLGIPGQIVEWVDQEHNIAKAQVSNVRRAVNVGLLAEGPDAVDIGDWVLIHVGFAMSKIDEEEAHATHAFLVELGTPYEEELAELEASAIE